MNTDKIYAEQLANEYALKDTSKVIALRKLDAKAKLPATVYLHIWYYHCDGGWCWGWIKAMIGCSVMCLRRFHYVCYRCDSAVCKNATKRNNERCLTTSSLLN